MTLASLLPCFPTNRGRMRLRSVGVRPRSIAAAGAILVLLVGGSSAGLVAYVAKNEAASEARLKAEYEERIEALQAKLNEAGQRPDEDDGLEARLRRLLARQDAFEARQAMVQSFAAEVGMGPLGLSPPGPASSVVVTSPVAAAHAYAPEAEPKPPGDELFQLRLRRPEGVAPDKTSRLPSPGENLHQAEIRLDRFERQQIDLLGAVIQTAEAEAMHLDDAIRRTGVDMAASGQDAARTGGPLVPAVEGSGMFRSLAAQAQASVNRLLHLRRSVATLPFGGPIDGEIDFSSGFGYRMDPFTRSPAMHTGLDFRAEYGAPVRATGAGRVVVAEYSGAYGNMVEIDHGNGVTTRYAHLSAITVDPGERVEAGTRIGHVGSTGRSTGPHLHYETRIASEPVNPHRFLKAGFQVAPVTTASR